MRKDYDPPDGYGDTGPWCQQKREPIHLVQATLGHPTGFTSFPSTPKIIRVKTICPSNFLGEWQSGRTEQSQLLMLCNKKILTRALDNGSRVC